MSLKVTFDKKMRFQVADEKRGISFAVDQPIDEGGDNSAPTPVEYYVSSLGACVGTMIAFYANSKNIDIEGLTVDVNFEKENNPYRVSKIETVVHYPGETDAKLQRILERVAKTCIIHNTMHNPPELVFKFPWTKS